MIYKLKRNYILRGWDKKAWVLVHRPENSYRTLTQTEFQTLLLCDGNTNLEADYVTDDIRKVLKQLEKESIVEPMESASSLEEDQNYHYYDNRFVRSAFWSVTGKCNYRCRHCYMDAPEGALGELSHEQAMELIDQMAQCGILRVNLSGGEPFVRKDFWPLVDRILSHNITISQVYTNGWLLTDAVLDEFEKRKLKPEFSISFDGVGWHDWMRGISGAEEAAIRALKLCIKRGFPTNVEMCIHKGNQDTLRETVSLLSDIGVPALKTSNVMQTELWRKNSEGNAMDIREYIEAMIRYIPYFYQDGMPMNVTLSSVINLKRGSRDYEVIPIKHNGEESSTAHYLCGAARYAGYITPEGRLLPCMPMTACKEQELFPLVQDIGLKKGLSDSFYMDIVDSRIRDLLAVNSKCAACAHKYQCGGGCRAIALEQTGNLMGCDGNYCILWNEGYVERIQETAEVAIAKFCRD